MGLLYGRCDSWVTIVTVAVALRVLIASAALLAAGPPPRITNTSSVSFLKLVSFFSAAMKFSGPTPHTGQAAAPSSNSAPHTRHLTRLPSPEAAGFTIDAISSSVAGTKYSGPTVQIGHVSTPSSNTAPQKVHFTIPAGSNISELTPHTGHSSVPSGRYAPQIVHFTLAICASSFYLQFIYNDLTLMELSHSADIRSRYRYS